MKVSVYHDIINTGSHRHALSVGTHVLLHQAPGFFVELLEAFSSIDSDPYMQAHPLYQDQGLYKISNNLNRICS